MIATKDFVELMTDQRVANQTERGLWKLGQVLYVKVLRGGRVSFNNAPITLTPKEKWRLERSYEATRRKSVRSQQSSDS